MAAETRLPAKIPVVIGAGDGVLVNVGIGAVRPGQMSCTIGTSGAVRMLNDAPLTDEKGRTWCYNLTETVWVLGAAINNGGIVLRWLRDRLNETDPEAARRLGTEAYALMTRNAGAVPAGSDGLIMLPFLTGERAPNWNADARGVLFGLALGHTAAHIIRATLEGVCYRMNSVMLALADVAGPPRKYGSAATSRDRNCGFRSSPTFSIVKSIRLMSMRAPPLAPRFLGSSPWERSTTSRPPRKSFR